MGRPAASHSPMPPATFTASKPLAFSQAATRAERPWAGEPFALLRWLLPVLAVVYALVAIGVRPWFRYRVHRWEVTDEAVYTLTGWLTRTWTLVPISRIQTVDVTRGVVQQLFGLATVAVLTASSQGTVRVPHLEADVARRVAEDLARRGG